MRLCSIEQCDKKHFGKSYCKNHYHSYMKYGDALYVEEKRQTRNKYCVVENCEEVVLAKSLCQKHYARNLRKGKYKSEKKRNIIESETCLVFGCNNKHLRHGFCKSHLTTINELKTPYRMKTIRLCGVKECIELHFGKGMCRNHFYEWRKLIKELKLDEFVNGLKE